MCRLIAARSWSPRGSELLGRLAALAARAAAGDPYLEAVTGGERRHCHGYGFLLAYRAAGDEAWRLVYERYDALAPGLGEEEACRRNLEAAAGAAERLRGILASAGEALLVFHVRRAGRSEPRGSLNTHPYHVTAAATGGPVELFLAHNGGLRKDALAQLLGVEASGYTDSHLLALYAARRVQEGAEPWQALVEGYIHARSGYDVALAVLEPGRGPRLYIAAGYAPGLDEARRRYYEPVLFEAEGAAGYVSSTIRDLAGEEGLDVDMWTPEHGVYEAAAGEKPRLLHGL